MGSNSESLGGLGIDLGLNFDGLQSDLQSAISAAQSAGQQMGAALVNSFDSAATGADAFQSAMDKLVSEGSSANDAFQKLTGSTQTFVEALQSGALNDFADNFGKITSEAQAAAPALEQVATSAKDAAGALQQMSSSSSGGFSLSGMFSGAQEGFASLTSGLGSLDQATTVTMGDMSSLGGSIAALGGIALGVGGLKMLASDMADASDNLTRADIALKALTGDAGAAQNVLQGLDQLGMSDGLSMPGLRQAAISMEALLPAGTDIVGVLGHVADAAAVMGGSIDGVASKFDRMVDSGTLAARSLGSIGLTLDDIGKSMTDLGATTDQMAGGVAAAFKSLDSEGRVEVLTAALQKFQGVAEDVANNTFGGLWQQLANTFEQDMAKMGESVLPFVQESMPSIKQAIDDTFGDTVKIKGFFQVIADGFAGVAAAAVTGLAGVGHILTAEDWTGVKQAAAEAADNVKTVWKAAQGEVLDDANSTTAKLAALYNNLPPVTFKLVPDFQQATDQMKAAADMASAVGATVVDVSAKTDSLASHFKSLGGSMGDAFTSFKTALANTSDEMQVLIKWIDDLAAAHQRVIDAAAKAGVTLQQYWQGVQDAAEKSMDAFNHLADSAPAAIMAVVDPLHTAAQSAKDAKAAFDSLMAVNPAPLNDLGQAFATLGVKAQSTKPDLDAMEAALSVVEKDMSVGWDDSRFLDGLASVDKAIANLAKTDLPEATQAMGDLVQGLINTGAPLDVVAGQMQAYEGYINKLAKTDLPDAVKAQGDYIAKLDEMDAPLHTINAAIQDWDKMQIQLAEDQGTSASKYLEQLAVMKQQTQDAADSIKNAFGNIFTDFLKSWNDTWNNASKAIADNIVDAKNWGDVWNSIEKGVEKSILEGLVGTAFKALRSEIDSLVGSLFPSINTGINSISGAVSGLGSAATNTTTVLTNLTGAGGESVTTLTGLTGAASSATPQLSSAGNAMTGLGGAAASGASSIFTMVGAIGSVVGALAGIAGDIMQAHADNLLGEIEVSTRSTMNDLANLRADQWSQYGGLFQRLGDIWATLQAMGGAGSGITQGDKNIVDSLASIGQTLLDIDTNVYNVLAELQKGISTQGSGSADLSGQSLTVLGGILTAANGIWQDENLVVQGIQNLAIDIQALGNVTSQGSSDFQKLFTNQSNSQGAQMDRLTKEISDNEAKIALDLNNGYTADAAALTAQNATLKAQLDAITNYGSQAMADAVTARNAALAEVDAAKTTADTIKALKDEQAADAAIAAQAAKDGNAAIAKGFSDSAAALQSQIDALTSIASSAAQTAANTGAMIDAIALVGSRGAGGDTATNTGTLVPPTTVTVGGRGGSTGSPVGTGTIPSPRGPSPTDYVPNTLPKFEGGGQMPFTGLAMLEKDEWVIPPPGSSIALPPDVLARIAIPASVPATGGLAPGVGAAPASAAPVTQHITFQVNGLSISDVARQLPAMMKQISPALAGRNY